MLLLILLLQIHVCFGAEHDTQQFDKANALYTQGAPEKALLEYKKISHKTGAVWFNMANAAYAQQDYAHALLYWLRAQKYGDAFLYKESHAHMQKLGIGSPENSIKERMSYFGILILKKIPVIIWQLLFLLVWYLFCWCRMKKYCCSAAKTGLFALLLLLLFVPIMIGYYTDYDRVVILAETADLYNGPNVALYKIGSVQKGESAKLLDTKKQWYKIAHADKIGWVERKAVAKI